MTGSDLKLFDFISAFVEEKGYSPTLREMKAACGWATTSTVHYHLSRLREQGLITFVEGAARTVRPVEVA